jgi:phytoene/squalene synthetase
MAVSADELREAYAHCRRLARGGPGTGILWGRFTAGALRRHLSAVRAFTRGIAELEGPGAFNEWRDQLSHLDRSRHPVFCALAATIEERNLSVEPFQDLLEGAARYQSPMRVQTYEELRSLMHETAEPQGQILLELHGHREHQLREFAGKICTAYRLTEYLLEIPRDLERDRIYIPLEDFADCGYSEGDLRMGVANERFRNLLKVQWKRARQLFEEGRPMFKELGGPAAWEFKLLYLRGSLLLRKIRRYGFDTLHSRPAIKKWDWPRLAGGVLLLR